MAVWLANFDVPQLRQLPSFAGAAAPSAHAPNPVTQARACADAAAALDRPHPYRIPTPHPRATRPTTPHTLLLLLPEMHTRRALVLLPELLGVPYGRGFHFSLVGTVVAEFAFEEPSLGIPQRPLAMPFAFHILPGIAIAVAKQKALHMAFPHFVGLEAALKDAARPTVEGAGAIAEVFLPIAFVSVAVLVHSNSPIGSHAVFEVAIKALRLLKIRALDHFSFPWLAVLPRSSEVSPIQKVKSGLALQGLLLVKDGTVRHFPFRGDGFDLILLEGRLVGGFFVGNLVLGGRRGPRHIKRCPAAPWLRGRLFKTRCVIRKRPCDGGSILVGIDTFPVPFIISPLALVSVPAAGIDAGPDTMPTTASPPLAIVDIAVRVDIILHYPNIWPPRRPYEYVFCLDSLGAVPALTPSPIRGGVLGVVVGSCLILVVLGITWGF